MLEFKLKMAVLQVPCHHLWFLLFPLLTFSISIHCLPYPGASKLLCGKERSRDKSLLIQNFVANMEALEEQVSKRRWGVQATGGSSMAPIYSLFQCFSGLSNAGCLLCFAESRTRLPRCLPYTSARIYLDGCFLRYENYSFFRENLDPKRDMVNCSSSITAAVDGGARSVLEANVEKMVRKAVDVAVNGIGFVEERSREERGTNIYGFAQCWRSLTRPECRDCIQSAGRAVRRCVPGREGRAMNAGCFLRYSTENFYDEMKVGEGTDKGHGYSRRQIILIAVVVPLAVAAFLSVTGICIFYRRLKKGNKAKKLLQNLPSAFEKSGLNFKYETLEKATDFFSPSRKLGQGATGSVYKGVLKDGKVVAVKRLFFNTRQWADEFFNEVNLINGIEHKNLVKLLGCSIEGPESLLVYEYVPNKSLNNFLFSKNKAQFLNWQQRLDIIIGTAEGLAYLHEGLTVKIIHRDIKSSNILLDESLKAKIADFGLVRCLAADVSHLSTAIAGTLGYMAPEYLVRGQLTEKADVYSFGVLLLETVCGIQNSSSTEEPGSLLHKVWEHYKSNTLMEAIDSCLKGQFPVELASNVLLVGLLCTQASVSLRPSMSEVLKMLTLETYSIPWPMQPPFLNSSAKDQHTSTVSGSFSSSTVSEGLPTSELSNNITPK